MNTQLEGMPNNVKYSLVHDSELPVDFLSNLDKTFLAYQLKNSSSNAITSGAKEKT